MPKEVDSLASEAIEEALAKNWKRAAELNKEIISFDSENIPALNRLAKAYIELEKYEDAKKPLKLVLKLDPINSTAKKNLALAKEGKKVLGSLPQPDVRNFIKEPGTTKEFTLLIISKGLTAKKFYLGEPLEVRAEGNKVSIYKSTGELVGVFEPQVAEKVRQCIKNGGGVSGYYLSGEEKQITILIKSSVPIFKSEKQDVKPYLKRDTIEEPEIELSIPEPEESA